jgi:phosphoglycolate phosphatase
VKAVVFDLDGTLVDSTLDIAAAVNATLEEDGLGPLAPEQIRAFTGYGAGELIRRAFEAAGGRATDGTAARYLTHYEAHPGDRSTLFKDAGQALPALRERGLRIAVCTNKETELSRTVLRALGVENAVDAIVGADDTPRIKPDPTHLLAALEAVGAAPDEALYVGDNDVDVEAAAAAGVPCVLVEWGSARMPQPRRIGRFAELLG